MRRLASLSLAGLVLAAAGCGAEPDPAEEGVALPAVSAESAALALVALAGDEQRSADQLEQLFEASLLEEHRAAASDALDELSRLSDPVVEGKIDLGVDGTSAVDLLASVPGGGEVRLSARARMLEDGSWRIVAFAGPSGWWPPRSGGQEDGLSVSAGPDS